VCNGNNCLKEEGLGRKVQGVRQKNGRNGNNGRNGRNYNKGFS
jgi:hypothetical protein